MCRYILSFDGGGVRAIAQVVLLKKIEQELNINIFNQFDLFAGTSAGATNALLIAANSANSSNLEKFWSQENLRTIMTQNLVDKTSFLQLRPKYSNDGKRKVFQKFFGTKTMEEVLKPVFVTAYDVELRKPILLKSYEHPETLIVEAANATSAAPIYFPTASMRNNSWLIDGGIAANNPALLAYVEAKKLFKGEQIKVFAIGTGLNRRKIDGKRSKDWGAIGWLKNDILGIMVESSLQHEVLKDLINDDYLRINSPLNKVNRRMDDYSAKNIEKIKTLGEFWWADNKDLIKDFFNK